MPAGHFWSFFFWIRMGVHRDEAASKESLCRFGEQERGVLTGFCLGACVDSLCMEWNGLSGSSGWTELCCVFGFVAFLDG